VSCLHRQKYLLSSHNQAWVYVLDVYTNLSRCPHNIKQLEYSTLACILDKELFPQHTGAAYDHELEFAAMRSIAIAIDLMLAHIAI